MAENRYLYYATLIRRPGWSRTVISRFLPEPSATGTNPHYRSGARTKLYLLERVLEIEETDAWKQQQQATQGKKASTRKAVTTKRQNLVAYVEKLVIVVPRMPVGELTDLACAHYNARRRYIETLETFWPEATADSDPIFLKRITTNYLRHNLTRYETELTRIAGKVGVDEAYKRLKARVNEAIYNMYPFLKI